MKRSDQSVAIYSLTALAAVALAGAVVLLSLGRGGAPELIAFAGMIGAGVLGWARGGTYYDPTPEVVPTPVVVDVEPAAVLPTSTPAVYPLPKDAT